MNARTGKIIAIVAVVAVLAAAAVLLFVFKPWDSADKGIIEEPKGDPESKTAIREFPGTQRIPTNIKIEKLNIDIEITPAGKDAGGHFEAPKTTEGVTWYKDGPSPGWSGNALITAHNYVDLVPGTFEKLHTLTPGDVVEFTYEGGYKGLFSVRSATSYEENDKKINDLMNLDTEARTSLITCSGDRKSGGGYTHRTFVLLDATEYLGPDGLPVTTEEGDPN